ncbi:MAG: class I SAM-dependent methyltransferase [Runella slithyformis]|nr:MAG: class I SAM-dependent methyltransferase [Runella slithyformis]TAG18784.1 MAG: class I SAM-dependent methyltransferase [Cytophagales bacterium]TAG40396.1 MAG: class I SAM-dependent methyltransferase [Cytophagia bacterium]TAF03582.1 MAG: class I SAM-dependent methyltransferase [Runella slithyformis]TAF23805.1 MAG: class I SAM-dependent methyltransferase [Runella slithyformis]
MAIATKITDIVNRKILRRDRDRWNYQYNLGRWEGLGDINELARFSVIAGYAQHLKPNGKVLEIGAGEGYLQQRFDKTKYSLYYSTDASDVAVENGKKYEDEKTKYVIADMNDYAPDQKFDVIIINEAIYYGGSVDKVLGRFNAYLEQGGIFIVSINGDERNADWHRMMEASTFSKIDGTTVVCTRNTFYITVLSGK